MNDTATCLFVRKFKTCVLIILLVIATAPIGLVAAEPENYLMCRYNKTVRTVRIIKVADECVTIYTKAGVDKEVGGGKHFQSCVNIMNNIRTNLEKADWKCREIEQATVTQ